METSASRQTFANLSQQLEELRINVSLALPHELRTPLNAILGFSEYLMSQQPERLPDADIILQMQTSIHENALRLHRLIENYLLYVHLKLIEHDVQKQRAEMWESDERLDTRSLIASVAHQKAQQAEREHDVQVRLADAELHLSAKSLTKIIEELVDNACKFSPSDSLIQLTSELSDDQWTLRIRDAGRGMSDAQIAQIGAFMQFERPQYEQQGFGLGLALAILLVHLNHGDFRIDSAPGQGTTITITFPSHPTMESSPSYANTTQRPHSGG